MMKRERLWDVLLAATGERLTVEPLEDGALEALGPRAVLDLLDQFAPDTVLIFRPHGERVSPPTHLDRRVSRDAKGRIYMERVR